MATAVGEGRDGRGRGYVGLNSFKVARQVMLGVRAPATLIAVRDTGTTVNEDPRVALRFRVEPLGEPTFEVTRKLTVSRIDVPRPGTRLDVAFDPADRTSVTFRRADLTAPTASGSTGDHGAPGHDRAAAIYDGDASGASSHHSTAANAASIDQLAQLAELHAAGALTDSEFACAKASVLGAAA